MKLLYKLYETYSPSHGEGDLITFIIQWVKQNVPTAVIDYDEEQMNLYIIKGQDKTYPCLVAHTDQVQRPYPEDYGVMMTGATIMQGFSHRKRAFCGLGADDKNGVWVALRCLELEPLLKVALFSREEIGCLGSSNARMEFFDDCRFVLQADRRGSSDFITCISGTELCTDEFVEAAGIGDFGYHEQEGAMSDVLMLSELGLKVSCANMSCGYYDPHTEHEYTFIPDLYNCIDLVRHIIHTCTDVYPAPERYQYTWESVKSEDIEHEVKRIMEIYPMITLEELEEYMQFDGIHLNRDTLIQVEQIYNKKKNKSKKNSRLFLF